MTESSAPVKIIDSFPNPTAYKYNEELWKEQHGNSFVIINCVSSEIEYPEHWTPLSIKCAFGGREYYHFKNHSLAVSNENFLILNEGAIYRSSIQSDNPTESFSLNFTAENIRQVFSCMNSNDRQLLDDPFYFRDESMHFIEKLYPYDKCLSGHLYRIRKMVTDKIQSPHLYIEALYQILEGMIVLNKHINREIDHVVAKRRSSKEELYKRLHLAKDYMDSCFHEDISLENLSKLCFLNSFHLLREFRKNFGITPHQYLMKQRMKEAEKLLLNSNRNIGEIGSSLKFCDLSSFSKFFKKQTGYSPENFRNLKRKKVKKSK
ncbi:MAG TPA: AraC family transcriptional regulator [Puia sp.]|nr:AraC family transcriptional regulator [Puia sp.]